MRPFPSPAPRHARLLGLHPKAARCCQGISRRVFFRAGIFHPAHFLHSTRQRGGVPGYARRSLRQWTCFGERVQEASISVIQCGCKPDIRRNRGKSLGHFAAAPREESRK